MDSFNNTTSQGDPTGLPISFAVGDTESDAPMLALASHPAVPAHAPATLGSQATWRASRPYQAGFAQAVDAFLGHRMSRSDSGRLGRHDCPQCELAPLTRDREALLLLLSAGEAGRQGIPSRTLKAALASARTRSAGD